MFDRVGYLDMSLCAKLCREFDRYQRGGIIGLHIDGASIQTVDLYGVDEKTDIENIYRLSFDVLVSVMSMFSQYENAGVLQLGILKRSLFLVHPSGNNLFVANV